MNRNPRRHKGLKLVISLTSSSTGEIVLDSQVEGDSFAHRNFFFFFFI